MYAITPKIAIKTKRVHQLIDFAGATYPISPKNGTSVIFDKF